MARYIDADSLYRRVKTHTNPYGKPTLDYRSGVKVLDMINQEPTADVVPKSEVENFNKSKGGFCPLCGSYTITQEMMEELRMAHKEPGQHGDPVGEKGVNALEAIKAEVAREIFEEVENEINNELTNNKKVLPQVEISNVLWNRVSGRINAFQGILEFIAELKKKYTEEKE